MHFINNDLEYITVRPDEALADVVESIWMVKNHSGQSREGTIIPDGKIDLFFLHGANNRFEIFISGICTHPITKPPFPRSTMFAISFHPTAAEYIFKCSFSDLKNRKQILPSDYWGLSQNDLANFDQFCAKVSRKIASLLAKNVDNRKKRMFDLIHSSKADITVKELSESVSWSSRQMNRYFNTWLGVPLKTYINIIRFSYSLKQLRNGDLYPELNYGDQSHFIREVKRFFGVRPRVLTKNENDRFIQLSLIPED